MTAAVLAIDGGNSKTDVALIGADGTVLAEVRGPGTSIESWRFEPSLAVLDELVGRAAEQAGVAPGGQLAQHTSAFLAGADLPSDEQRLADALTARGWSPSVRAGNDTFAVLRAGTQRPWGVGVTCGAGINCVGVAPDGAQTRFLALGRFTGDWGGGMDLGLEIMWWATRAEDGRGEPTGLSSGVAEFFGRPSAADVALDVHNGTIAFDRLSTLTRVLFQVSAAGDAVAVQLVHRLAEEISGMVLVAMRRLVLTALDTEVALGGGVLMARDPLLIKGITDRVRADAPRAQVTVVDVPPIAGAALLGLDHLDLDESAHDRLRATYTDRDAA